MASPRTRKAVEPAVMFPYTLNDVIQATLNAGFVYTAPAFHEPLIKSGDVVINKIMEDENGNFATRATAKHLNLAPVAESEPMINTESAPVVAAKPKFEIEAGIPIPEKARRATGLRAGRTAVYPFDSLELNQSFFVADKSADKPAEKALASTVAGANSRYTEEIPGETRVNRKGNTVPATKQLRKFKVFASEKTDPVTGEVIKGARVFRVAVE